MADQGFFKSLGKGLRYVGADLLGDTTLDAREKRGAQSGSGRAKVDASAVVPKGTPPPAGVAALRPEVMQPGGTPVESLRGPRLDYGTGKSIPGTGVITDVATGRKVWVGADGQVQSSGERQGASSGTGIRQSPGRYSFEGSAADLAKFNKPVSNTRGPSLAPADTGGQPSLRRTLQGETLPRTDYFAGKNYNALYQNEGARSAARTRDARIQGIMDREQFKEEAGMLDAQARALNAETAADEVGQRQGIKALENQGQLAAENLRGQYGLRQAAITAGARDGLTEAQAEKTRRSTELFDKWRTETDPEVKAQLLNEYNTLTGAKEERGFAPHYGETTNPDLTTTPYAIVTDANGRMQMVRPQEGGAQPQPREQLKQQATSLPAPAQAALKAWGASNPNASDEEIAAKINELNQGK